MCRVQGGAVCGCNVQVHCAGALYARGTPDTALAPCTFAPVHVARSIIDPVLMTRGSSVRLDIQSSLDMLEIVQAVSDHIGRAAGLDEDALHWIGVAVRECVINAIKHGNQSDDRKRVHVEFTLLDGDPGPGIAIRVRDEGRGFDPASLPDCREPENLLKSNGRGIFLIRTFMDELELRRAPEGGMEVVMVKRAQPQQA